MLRTAIFAIADDTRGSGIFPIALKISSSFSPIRIAWPFPLLLTVACSLRWEDTSDSWCLSGYPLANVPSQLSSTYLPDEWGFRTFPRLVEIGDDDWYVILNVEISHPRGVENEDLAFNALEAIYESFESDRSDGAPQGHRLSGWWQ